MKNIDDKIEKAKAIVALFLKKNASEINSDSAINASVLQGSVLIHRLYAELAEAGIVIPAYQKIKTFGEIEKFISTNELPASETVSLLNHQPPGIGIDIESVDNFKTVSDYRADSFYSSNFTESEISYCLLKSNPVESLCGIFAAKEAIQKSDNQFAQIALKEIEITHTSQGKPYFKNYEISISHSNGFAVAVAVPKGMTTLAGNVAQGKSSLQTFVLLFSFLFSATALAIVLYLLLK